VNDIAEQRPSFFEGEVLSAADLDQLVTYVRDQNARHLLGGHTWGIVAGLELLEQTSPTGSVDVYLLPGYAVDGYGRGVLVVNPLRLSVDWFNGQPSGPVRVWIRYDQGDTSAVRPGFQVCCGENEAYSRVAESYAIEVGNLSLAKQQSGIGVAGETVDDARTASRTFNDLAPVVCDASIPYQNLPLEDDSKSRWLIPVGEVNWKAGNPGSFGKLYDDADTADEGTMLIHSRRLRRYVGVVAENVYAADGLIRLRRRTTDVAGTVDQSVVDDACEKGDLDNANYDDDLELCGGVPTPTELVWVEGRMRVTGDLRVLSPARIELRDENGTNLSPTGVKGSAATFLERTESDALDNMDADLAVVISKASDDSNTRFLIQRGELKDAPDCATVTFTKISLVTVLDDGKVGIGTEEPDELLTIANEAGKAYLHLHDEADKSDLYVGADKFGGVLATTDKGDLRFHTGGTDPSEDTDTKMIITATGEVGIGTTTPSNTHNVTVFDEGKASIIVETDEDHELLLQAYDGGALVAANFEDDSLVLGAGGDNEYVWITPAGLVGVHTDSPSHDVSVHGSSKAELQLNATSGTNRRLLLSADSDNVHVGSNSDHPLHLRTSNTNRLTVKTNGNVGINTTDPQHYLDVRGNIALGSTGQYYAPGGINNWAIIAGNISSNGDESMGDGFDCDHTPGTNYYDIKFTNGFSETAVVTASLRMDPPPSFPPTTLPTVLVHNIDGNGFRVTMYGGSTDEHSFCFHAFCKRT
jgi:hypothetical protein